MQTLLHGTLSHMHNDMHVYIVILLFPATCVGKYTEMRKEQDQREKRAECGMCHVVKYIQLIMHAGYYACQHANFTTYPLSITLFKTHT